MPLSIVPHRRRVRGDRDALSTYFGPISPTVGTSWNRIVLFSTLATTYTNDDTGMASAISAASSGDTIILPPCSLSNNYSIPSGVVVHGHSRNDSVLSGQITLGVDSIIESLSVIRSENDATDIYGVIAGVAVSENIYIYNCNISVTQAGAGNGYAIKCLYGTTNIKYSYIYGSTSDFSVAPEWWEPDYGMEPVAIWQPKGAASLADSYIDLSGSGNDAFPGVAPSWATDTGWTFTGTEWLDTPLVPSLTNQYMTMMIYIYRAENDSIGVGVGGMSGLYVRGYLYNSGGGANPWVETRTYTNGSGVSRSSGTPSEPSPLRVLAVSYRRGYREDVEDYCCWGVMGTPRSGNQVHIGIINGWDPGVPYTGKIYAAAVYNTELSQAQITTLKDAMRAL